ncbi:hypothetical protein D030_4464B, partial [Vibrio parahaemolyticus AQ3810]
AYQPRCGKQLAAN